MDLGLDALSKLTVFSKYAKYVPELKRRETWEEIVNRYRQMMIKKYPKLEDQIMQTSQFILDKKVLPSMRALQFAGPAAEVNNSRIYNCCYLPIDSIHSFSETMFLLLGGTGVGYSVQKQHVAQLPAVTKPGKLRNYLIEDSIMGWADAVKVLMKAYLEGGFMPKFDFRAIRKKGARLITAGGKAPGPEPLKICLAHVQAVLDRKQEGESLSPLECHDILCHIANSVLAGGIRRSAMISLFSHDDEEMITCKYGNWWETNEQRGRANNSAVLLRGSVGEEEFNSNRVTAAAFFGSLQAGFTDFHYLRPIWQKTTQKDALLGIGMTGIGSGEILKYNLEAAAHVAKLTNAIISEQIGTNEAARVTCIKPSGTTSLVLGTASGIHAWHAPYYLRTMRFGKNEDVAAYLMVNHPELVEDDVLRPHDTVCVRIPVKAPEGSIFRTETAIDTLERVKKFSTEWVRAGHNIGDNTHNVSATISIKQDEWPIVGEWMWENAEFYNGLSVLPYWGGTYKQAPFEDITEEEYISRLATLHTLDLTKVTELDDTVEFGQVAACAGGACEIQ